MFGIGAGATTKLRLGDRVARHQNIKNISEYLPRIEELLKKKREWLSGTLSMCTFS